MLHSCQPCHLVQQQVPVQHNASSFTIADTKLHSSSSAQMGIWLVSFWPVYIVVCNDVGMEAESPCPGPVETTAWLDTFADF